MKAEGTPTHISGEYTSHGMQGESQSVGWVRVPSHSIDIIEGRGVVNGEDGSVFENLGLLDNGKCLRSLGQTKVRRRTES